LALTARRDLLLQVRALRHQLAVLRHSNRRFRTPDRLLWMMLSSVWPQWRDALLLVQPATVERWHRDWTAIRRQTRIWYPLRRFGASRIAVLGARSAPGKASQPAKGSSFQGISRAEALGWFDWRWWRRSRRPGRPHIDWLVRDLIGRLADDNRLWGAPRTHGELLKLRFLVSGPTVSRYLSTPPSHWRCASTLCSVVEWPAPVRRTGLGAHVSQDHLRDRTGMRRSTGRAPPQHVRTVASRRSPERCFLLGLHGSVRRESGETVRVPDVRSRSAVARSILILESSTTPTARLCD
jgi:hypothetical protein